MKTGILVPSVSRKAGGLFESGRRMAHNLMESGVDINVFSIKDQFTGEDDHAWPVVPRVYKPLRPYSFSYAPGLTSGLHGADSDLLHLNGLWMYTSVACANWARKTRRPYMISPHGMLDQWAVRNSRWKKTAAAILFEKRNLKKAACLHALSEKEMLSFRSYGLKNPVCIIPNGIDLPCYNGHPAPPWRTAGVDGRKVILYLGRIHPKKGIEQLLLGWAKAGRRNGHFLKNWVLVIAGWGQLGHEAKLKEIAASLKLQDSIKFTGPQLGENKTAAYKNANAFVLSSFSEGLPIAVLEAWSYGLPVLMTPECNLPEGLRAQAAIETSISPDAIADGLLLMCLISDEQRMEMGSRGARLVKERFAWPKIASEMKEVYEWMLGGGPKPGCVVD